VCNWNTDIDGIDRLQIARPDRVVPGKGAVTIGVTFSDRRRCASDPGTYRTRRG
jgi:hypothetical protein